MVGADGFQMITELRIRNLGIIRMAELEFEPGMIAFTGETGAGKTMLTSALGLILGDRADYGLVGSANAQVEARVEVADASVLAQVMDESGVSLEGNELVLSRSLTSSGRSKSFAGGRSVPASVLADLAARLTSRHSQSNQIGLRKPARQRIALDQYGGESISVPMDHYRSLYLEFTELSDDLRCWQDDQTELKQQTEYLERELAEIIAIAPRPNELAELADELTRLSHTESLRESTEAARSALVGIGDADGSQNADALVSQGLAQLQSAARLDPSLSSSANLILQVQTLLSEVSTELSSYTAE
jgi:DNA repair protein RecN (Recombination protein N)